MRKINLAADRMKMTIHQLYVILNYISVFVMLGCCTAIFTHEESR